MVRSITKGFLFALSLTLLACAGGGRVSTVTGWKYDFTASDAFRGPAAASFAPPGMVQIPGGRLTIDDNEEFETAGFRMRPNELNTRKTISVNSFYMDKHEIRNIDWREYIGWLNAVYGKVAPERVEAARPDLRAWQEGLSSSEPFINDYFTHPAYDNYPVVCVSWEQAAAYCKWRTDRVNEMLLVKAGVIPAPDFNAIAALTTVEEVDNTVFSSERYFGSGNLYQSQTYTANFVSFRLPTEDEWEYAAYARRETDPVGKVYVYPWSSLPVDKITPRQRGQMKAHYNSAGTLPAKADLFSRTVPVNQYEANDLGLYNMAGNVNEWVYDTYTSRGTINRIDSTTVLDVFLPEYHKIPDARVYKGGSWNDSQYWLHPSARRYHDPRKGASFIGFRCAMSIVQDPRTPVRR